MPNNEELNIKTKILLRNRPVSLEYKTISAAIGVSESWLRLFAHDDHRNYTEVRVRKLHDYLRKAHRKVSREIYA